MTKAKLTKRERIQSVNGGTCFKCGEKDCNAVGQSIHVCTKPITKYEENISAIVGFLVVVIIFVVGINLGMFASNFLREPTWHSPKGCPIYVGGTNGK